MADTRGGLWIASPVIWSRDPNVRKLARALGVTRLHALGLLHAIVHYLAEFHQDGCVDDLDDDEVAAACDWRDAPSALLDALVAHGFVDLRDDGRRYISDWDAIGGRLHRWREANRDRQQRSRSNRKASDGHRDTTRDRHAASHGDRERDGHADEHVTGSVTLNKSYSTAQHSNSYSNSTAQLDVDGEAVDGEEGVAGAASRPAAADPRAGDRVLAPASGADAVIAACGPAWGWTPTPVQRRQLETLDAEYPGVLAPGYVASDILGGLERLGASKPERGAIPWIRGCLRASQQRSRDETQSQSSASPSAPPSAPRPDRYHALVDRVRASGNPYTPIAKDRAAVLEALDGGADPDNLVTCYLDEARS